MNASASANDNDLVAEVVGGNKGEWQPESNAGSGKVMSLLARLESIKNMTKFLNDKYPVFDEDGNQANKTSPHSTYGCKVNCGDKKQPPPPEQTSTNFSDISKEDKP